MPKKTSKKRHTHLPAVFLTLPLLVLLVLGLVSSLAALNLALQNRVLRYSDSEYVWFANVIRLAGDRRFLNAIPAFARIPREIEEAAALDGYGPYQVFWHVALPVASTTLLGGIVFSFVLVWNELMIALALTSSKSVTLPVIASAFTSMGQEVPWGVVNASTVLLALPPLIFVGILSRLLNSMLKNK